MILTNRFTPSLSVRSLAALVCVALVVLPSCVQTTAMEARGDSTADTPATPAPRPSARQGSDCPYAVQFVQGATQYLDGDEIRIVEVRGTADTFVPGNLYWIKGTYKLASHDRAMLAAFTTAKEAKDGSGPTLKVQSTTVNKGSGEFTLFYPMWCSGWPHVSFYPARGGSSFGGIYFGMGDSVLQQWWGSSSDSALFRLIETLGGRIEREDPPNGPVISIDFAQSRVLKDQDIHRLQPFKRLTTLGLGHTGITDAGLANLAEVEKSKLLMLRSGALRSLATLYVDNTRITDTGVNALKDLPKLTTLGLGHTRTTDAGLETVQTLVNLTHLYLDNTELTDTGVERLRNLKNLTTLGLGHTATSDVGLMAVGNLKELAHLYVNNTRITDVGLAYLQDLKKLTTLGLGHTAITDAGLKKLKSLKNLLTLYIDHTQVTDEGVKRLQDSLPNANIIR